MSLRIREDGRILCAAMHPAEAGDTYLHDGIHYKLTVETRAIVTEAMHQDAGRGGHAVHGEWWWRDEYPADVVIERRPRTPRAIAERTLDGLCAYDAVDRHGEWDTTAANVANFLHDFSLLSAERLASVAAATQAEFEGSPPSP